MENSNLSKKTNWERLIIFILILSFAMLQIYTLLRIESLWKELNGQVKASSYLQKILVEINSLRTEFEMNQTNERYIIEKLDLIEKKNQ